MDLLNQHYLWASCLWSAVASGYLVYGWRQKAMMPFIGGLVMLVASIFLSALWMSLACVAAMLAVWWLSKQGY